MTYEEATAFIFQQHAVFERSGASAYKPGLGNVAALSAAFGSPHAGMRCIHVAGTNGKGTTSHTIAAALREAGYRTGLYTSPHIADFRERILVDGSMISKEAVVDFTKRYQQLCLTDLHASFFELATVMAFEHFRREHTDVAVIEVGLGGRLDSTNIINPDLSVITNISLDHTNLLGKTRAEIAREKAGIIKAGVPVVIGEADDEVREVFVETAKANHAPIIFADKQSVKTATDPNGTVGVEESPFGSFATALRGEFQKANVRTIICAIEQLCEAGYDIPDIAVRNAFAKVGSTLHGRWERHNGILCDCGHNPAAWRHTARYLESKTGDGCIAIIGFSGDKDVDSIVEMLPKGVDYYAVAAPMPRALPAAELAEKLIANGLNAKAFGSVAEAIEAARGRGAGEIFLGGSFYVVAEYLGQ